MNILQIIIGLCGGCMIGYLGSFALHALVSSVYKEAKAPGVDSKDNALGFAIGIAFLFPTALVALLTAVAIRCAGGIFQ